MCVCVFRGFDYTFPFFWGHVTNALFRPLYWLGSSIEGWGGVCRELNLESKTATGLKKLKFIPLRKKLEVAFNIPRFYNYASSAICSRNVASE